MPDISMCMNTTCPLRDKCYRATAVPNEYTQSYSVFNLNADGTCNWFWDRVPHHKNGGLTENLNED